MPNSNRDEVPSQSPELVAALQSLEQANSNEVLFDYMCRAEITGGRCTVMIFDRVGDGFGARIISFQADVDPQIEVYLRGALRCTALPNAWSGRRVSFSFRPLGRSEVMLTLKGATPADALLGFGALGGTGLGDQVLLGESQFGEAAPFEIATSPDNQVVNLNAGSIANGAWLEIWNRSYTPAQHWQLEESAASTGYFLLKNVLSGKAITVQDMSPEPGAALVQWEINGKDNQLWSIEHAPQELTRVVFASRAHPELVMDLRGAVAEDGTVIQQWKRNGQFNQAWLLRTVRQ
jgi:hypothetical protein